MPTESSRTCSDCLYQLLLLPACGAAGALPMMDTDRPASRARRQSHHCLCVFYGDRSRCLDNNTTLYEASGKWQPVVTDWRSSTHLRSLKNSVRNWKCSIYDIRKAGAVKYVTRVRIDVDCSFFPLQQFLYNSWRFIGIVGSKNVGLNSTFLPLFTSFPFLSRPFPDIIRSLA